MAEFFPSNILDNVLKQLELPIFQSNKLNFLQRIRVRDLRSKLELIKCVIEDAELMAVLFPDVVGKWVRDLQRVLYEIDDLLDEVITRSMPCSGVLKKVHLRLYSLPLDLTVAPKLKSFNKRLESIVKECYKCNLLVQPAPISSNTGGGIKNPVARKGILRYHLDYMKDGGEFYMIGRDDDKKKVIDLLFDEYATWPVVSISGEAGVGKTTLCHAIYNDEEVGNHFDSRLWVDYEDVNDSKEKQDQLKHEINSSIKTLLVLDSLPPSSCIIYKSEYWSDLRDLIATSHKGSKILLNSLLPPRSGQRDSKYRHELKNDLCEEHCRLIFEKAAFAPGHDREEWMTDLGKEIADKCPGNPALLRAVGTLLYQNDDKALWDYFAHDFDFTRQYHHYCEISRASRILPKGQQLAGYLALFTKNKHKYQDLLYQCEAHGFFTNSSATIPQRLRNEFFIYHEMEDHWDDKGDYRDVLSNFGINQKDIGVISRLAGSEAVFLGLRTDIGVGEEVRHVAIDRPSSSAGRQRDIIHLPRSLTNDAVHKRTLLFVKDLSPVRMSVKTLDMLISKLLHLRVLDLHDLALKALPSSVGKLIHLRYVDLSRNDFKQLPKSIGRLKNLETLKLYYCDKLVKLPRCIKSLHQLKRLALSMCFDLTGMPSAIAEMTSLETLDRFVVCPHNGGLSYLKNLNNLRGSLSIELPRLWEKTAEEAEQANLKSKQGLTSVKFKWSGAYKVGDGNDNYDVLDKLEPCTNIDSLYIVNFGGTTFPSWITSLGMQNHLTRIAISHCRGCRILPPFHKMPKLKYLTLTSMDIEYLQDDNNNNRGDASADAVFFPALRELKIGRMPKLIGWSRDMSKLLKFSDLGFVEIWECPCLMVMPPFSTSSLTFMTIILQDISKKTLQGIDWIADCGDLHILSSRDMVSLPNEIVTKLPWNLVVKDCDKWQVFWANETKLTPLTWKSLSEGFQRLTQLTIKNCRAMKYMSSSLRHLINLEWLEISRCSEDLDCLYDEDEDGMPWKALQRLERLQIQGFDKLETLPKALLQHLPGPLFTLALRDCKSLKSCFHFSELNEDKVCPIEEMGEPKMLSGVFRSLKDLFIVNCPEIKYLSGSLEQLVMLEDLEISKCSEELDCLYKENDDGMPWKALQKLQTLKIKGFENLAALPKGFQHLDQLCRLVIVDCTNLEGGLDSLPRLKKLFIKSCPHFSKERTRRVVEVFEEEQPYLWYLLD